MSDGAVTRPAGRGPGARPVRVLVLDHTGSLGGAELALVRLCQALDRELVDVRVILFADGPLVGALRAAGVPTQVLPLGAEVVTLDRRSAGSVLTVPRIAGRTLAFTVALAREIGRLRPDVVHTTSLKADLLGLLAAPAARRPLVWHVHDRISPDYLPRPLVSLLRALARLPRAVVVNSEATARTLDPVPSTTAYPGFAPEQAVGDVEAALRRRSAHSPEPVIGLIGRISPTKGQLELVRAAPRILARHPHARFRFVGAPMFGAQDYAQKVRLEAEALGVADRVDWTGFAADPAAELDRLAVCVHASPVPEPFGQVVVEAMIRGVPVVATRAGGVPEILEPAGTDGEALGLLVEPGDVPGLAEAVCAVLDDSDAALRRARAAYASACERFPASRTAAVITPVWQRAAGRAR